MLNKPAFLVLFLLASFDMYAQKSELNFIDENGLPQGYWKVSRPGGDGHNYMIYEGLYYNGKQVGVWKYWHRVTRVIYRKDMYSDTLGEQYDEVNYYANGNAESQGHMILKLVHDSIQYYEGR